ncbi:MAG: YwaF family protein [Clostridia bacterium]|nr:YwaF family protein [Clostridia bacterium]MBR4799038.1 YwaF family protein [Clostridia bacterium]MBR5746056.1 YwaF family protein [Clostridia bacterium]
MNFIERIIYNLSGEMERPGNYGWFHLMFIAIVIAASLFFLLKLKDCSDRTERILLLAFWAALVLFETYKQLQFSVSFNDAGTEGWDYQWYAFPYQFCDTPLYLLPFAALLKEGKARSAVKMFLATYTLFAGLVVYIYPNDVFIRTIGVDIQTMFHHGTQIVLGLFLGARLIRSRQMKLPVFVRAIGIFVIMVAVAFALNNLVPLITEDTFNMYYIGPVFECTLPVLSDIYAHVPYAVFLAVYVLGFTFAASLLFGAFTAAKKLRAKRGAPA